MGVQTLRDVLAALAAPPADPRDTLLGVPPPLFLTARDLAGDPALAPEAGGGGGGGGGTGPAVRAATGSLSADKLVIGTVYKARAWLRLRLVVGSCAV